MDTNFPCAPEKKKKTQSLKRNPQFIRISPI